MLARLLKLALTLALLGAAAPAWATTYFVAQDSAGNFSGSSCANAKALSWFNANAAAGDIAQMCDGTYTTAPDPANSGSAGNYITYIGDVSDTNDVIVPSIGIDTDYISIKGMRSSDITFNTTADYCSLSYISAMEGGWSYSNDSAFANVIYRCNFYQASSTTNSQIRLSGKASGGVFRRNVVACPSVDNSGVRMFSGGDALAQRFTLGTVDSNRITYTLTTSDVSGVYLFGVNNTSFKDNRIEVTSNVNSTQLWGVAMRDSARFNTFRRDTIYLYGDANGDGGCAQVGPTVSGSYNGTCDYGKMDSCTIVQFDSDCEAVRWEGGSVAAPEDGWELRHNVIVGGFDARYGKDSTIVEHGTFYSPDGWAFSLYNKSGSDSWTNMVVRWNIFYRNSIQDCSGASYSAPYETEDASTGYWDRNLAQAGTHSGTYDSNGRVANSNCSAGCCATMTWETVNDDSSSWKSPYFRDSTSAATFDPRPVYGSWAIRGWADAGGYVGARRDSVESGDTPPDVSAVGTEDATPVARGIASDITWTATDNSAVSYVNIRLSTDNGSTYSLLAANETNDGVYEYSWPASINQAKVKVTAYDAAAQADSMESSTFSVTDQTTTAISLTAPDGGQSWNEGQGRTITWTATPAAGDTNVTEIRLWYTTNNGGSWTSIATGEANDGAYLWTVPNVERESNQMRIRVWATDAAGNQSSDSSSTAFTVLDTLRPNKVRNLWASSVHWTAVNLRWTGVANCTTTVLKYDTSPLTESGANNFRTHGTSVSTGTPSAAGVLDSATVTGLTPGTRYYFALRHIDNDGVTPETSLVSIGEVRTTRPSVLRGNRARSTLNYPLIGLQALPVWQTAVGDTWPRTVPGYPMWDDMGNSSQVTDSMQNAMKGFHAMHTTLSYGLAKNRQTGVKSNPQSWGQPDSVFKANAGSSAIVFSTSAQGMYSGYKQHGPSTDTSSTFFAVDDPWRWGELNNWFRATQDTAGTRKWGSNTTIYPEGLYIWSQRQTGKLASWSDTCTWQSFYGGVDSCYGMDGNALKQHYNILWRDTTTGELVVTERMAEWTVAKHQANTAYFSDPTRYQVDVSAQDFAWLEPDRRLYELADRPDTSRSGGTKFLGDNYAEFLLRWRGAAEELLARQHYYRDEYLGRIGYASGNHSNATQPQAGEWGSVDALELNYRGDKGTGGINIGILGNLYGRRFSESPNIEPAIGAIYGSLRDDAVSPIEWPSGIRDSAEVYVDPSGANTANRWRLWSAFASMFDDLFPMPLTAGDNNQGMDEDTDAGVSSDVHFRFWFPHLWPYYWDETYVSVQTGEAQRFNAYGTGTGKGWLGKPIQDKFTWGNAATASDTNYLDYGATGHEWIDGSFRTMVGWRPTAYSSSNWDGGAAGALGIIDTVRIAVGNSGGPDTVVRLRRAAIDHSAYYDMGIRNPDGFAIPLYPGRQHSIRFWARAESTTYITVGLRSRKVSPGNASGSGNFLMCWIDSTWREYEVQCGRQAGGNPAAFDSAQVAFYCGDTLGTVYIDDVSLWNRAVGFMYREFENGVVFVNPDTGWVYGDSSGVTAWRSDPKIINYQTVFGDTATYDYRLIKAPANSTFQPLNNGRIFGYAGAAVDTLPAGQAKFVIRASNGYWNTFPADGGRGGRGRLDRLIRGRGR